MVIQFHENFREIDFTEKIQVYWPLMRKRDLMDFSPVLDHCALPAVIWNRIFI